MDRRIIAALAGTSVVSAAAGVAAGYVFAVKRLKEQFETELAQQMEAARWSYKRLYKVEDLLATPEQAAAAARDENERFEKAAAAAAIYRGEEVPIETLHRIADGLRAIPAEDVSTEELTVEDMDRVDEVDEPDESALETGDPEAVETFLDLRPYETTDDILRSRTLFETAPTDWPEYEDYVAKLRSGRSKPYLIHVDMHMAGEVGYTQNTLTWFDGDGVLVDEQEHPISDVDTVVGKGNLVKFGMFTNGDPNVLYVRNDKLQLDFEICKVEGTYSEAIGLQDHGPRVKTRR